MNRCLCTSAFIVFPRPHRRIWKEWIHVQLAQRPCSGTQCMQRPCLCAHFQMRHAGPVETMHAATETCHVHMYRAPPYGCIDVKTLSHRMCQHNTVHQRTTGCPNHSCGCNLPHQRRSNVSLHYAYGGTACSLAHALLGPRQQAEIRLWQYWSHRLG